MKKNFVRVMLFGALTLAVTTTVTSCKDYDDDVKGLQEQIDKITSTSPVSTDDMKAAIDAAKTELQGKVDRLEALLNDKAAQTKLESEIARIEKALKEADAVVAADLAKQLATAKNDLTTLINAKADATVVTKLQERVAELEKMQGTLSSLIEAEKKFKASGDISGYKNTGFAAFVNQSIMDAIGDTDPNNMGAIAAYVTKTVQTAVSDQAKALNQHITTLTGGSISSLEGFLDKIYGDLYGKDGAIKKQLDSLNELLEAINIYVGTGEGQYADYAAIIKQIDDTKKQLAALNLPTDKTFDAAVQEIIKTELGKADGTVQQLETKLQKEINALKGMIQSIVYVPESKDRSVNFNTLYASYTAPDARAAAQWLPVVSVNQVEATFRVSPMLAVAELLKNEEGKYKISTEYTKLTRATGEFFTITDVKAVEGEPNMIKVVLNAGKAATSYAIALTVTDRDEANRLNDITSDYFAAIKEDLYIQKAEYKAGSDKTTLINDDGNDEINYLKDGSYQITVSTNRAGTTGIVTKTPAELNIPETPFSVEFGLEDGQDNDLFTFETGILKVATPGAEDNLGKTCTINSVVTVQTATEGAATAYAAKKYSPVTIISEIKEYTLTKAVTGVWDGVTKEYAIDDVDKNAILKLCGNATDLGGLTVTDVSKVTGVKFALDASTSKKLAVVVTKETITNGEAQIVATIKVSEILTVKVTGKVTVNYPKATDYTLTDNTLTWDGSNARLLYAFGKENDKVASVTVARDLKDFFTNYDAISAKALGIGTNISIASDNESVVINGSTLTLPATYDGKAIKVIISINCGEHALYTKNMTIQTPDLRGTFAYEVDKDKKILDKITKEDVTTIVDRKKAIGLADGHLIWKDVKEKEMWPIVDVDYFKGTTAKAALAIYGLDVKYGFADSKDVNNQYFTLSQDGTLTLKNNIAELPSIENDIVVKVKVMPQSKYWGNMSPDQDKVLTVTVKKWQDD